MILKFSTRLSITKSYLFYFFYYLFGEVGKIFHGRSAGLLPTKNPTLWAMLSSSPEPSIRHMVHSERKTICSHQSLFANMFLHIWATVAHFLLLSIMIFTMFGQAFTQLLFSQGSFFHPSNAAEYRMLRRVQDPTLSTNFVFPFADFVEITKATY